jgi:ParB-like chromosome segregation protein Spo0J
MISNKTFKVHPLARKFSRKDDDKLGTTAMSDQEYADLKEDIRANGLKIPILINKKKDTILDGATRWKIAHELKMTLPDDAFEVFQGKPEEEEGEIISRNVLRRHLTPDQRAMIISMTFGPAEEKAAKERQSAAGSFKGKAKLDGKGSVAEALAKKAGVGKSTMEKAEKIRKSGGAELAEDVLAGKQRISKAAKKVPSKRKPKQEKPFEDVVYAKWITWFNRFAPPARNRVRELVHGWTTEKAAAKK